MLEQPTVIAAPSPADLRRHQPSKAGMTMLEVILAIAVAGFVLAAAVSLLVSISSIWAERSQRHFFVDHVDGVTEFLNATFATAGTEIATSEDSGGSLLQTADEPIGWARPPGFSDSKEPLLNFKLTKAPPILVGIENAPLLGLDTFLHFDRTEGLSLLWYSILQEEAEDLRDLRRTMISPLVTGIQYIYWDENFEKWETEDAPMEGDGDDQYILPRFITLTFEYESDTQERTFTIPVPSKSALIY
jgi:prepilin-type N-terminal cleavage/methylation domain-containing protein